MEKLVINPTFIQNTSADVDVKAEGYIDYDATQAWNHYVATGVVSNFNDKASVPKFGGEFNMQMNKDGSVRVGKFWITKVIHNNPATIVFWSDGTKTVARIQDGEAYEPTTGLMVCVLKKLIGNDQTQKLLNDWADCETVMYGPYPEFEYVPTTLTMKDIRKKHREK
jgi:hypothetical protein